MRRNYALVKFIFAILLGAILIVLMAWGNFQYAQQNPGGNDFLVHWMGTQVFIREGISPYSEVAAMRIQTAAYGRPAAPGEHELRVAYPLYSIILFLPFAFITDFVLARAIWMTALEVGLVLLAFISIRISNWKPPLVFTAFFLLFSLLWYHALRPLINGNAVIFVALGIATILWAIRKNSDELAGVVMAFITIKPQLAILFIAFIMLWAIFSRRWKIIGWFLGVMVILIGFSLFLLPDWISQNLTEVIRYSSYNPPGTLRAALSALLPGIGNRLGWVISGILVVILLVEWWFARRADLRGFLWTSCLTLVISQWIGIQTDPGNFIILYPALVLVFSLWEERWAKRAWIFSLLCMIILLLGIWILFVTTIQYDYQPIQSPIMFGPLPGLLLIMLYWVRAWAFRSPYLWTRRSKPG